MKDFVLIAGYSILYFFDVVLPEALEKLRRKIFLIYLRIRKNMPRFTCFRRKNLRARAQAREQREIKAYRCNR